MWETNIVYAKRGYYDKKTPAPESEHQQEDYERPLCNKSKKRGAVEKEQKLCLFNTSSLQKKVHRNGYIFRKKRGESFADK
jgi:hypothetical protein